jgi:hypothetical protein
MTLKIWYHIDSPRLDARAAISYSRTGADWVCPPLSSRRRRGRVRALARSSSVRNGFPVVRSRSRLATVPALQVRDACGAVLRRRRISLSGRRFLSDLRDARASGFISRAPHFNCIFNYVELPELIADSPPAESLPREVKREIMTFDGRADLLSRLGPAIDFNMSTS